jgi:Fe-S cluster biogenesis protein NfuA
MTDSSKLKITGEPTLDPQVCKFVVSQDILPGSSYTCRTRDMAEGSPLLEDLLDIEGVTQVMVSGNTLTVAKSNDDTWPAMGQKIGPVIRKHLTSGEKYMAEDLDQKQPSEHAIREKIQDLFDNHINPQIASHGGRVELADVEGTRVLLRLGGGCQGCASANQTLKMGIEKAIRQVVPEVTEVVDITNHAAGINPYY